MRNILFACLLTGLLTSCGEEPTNYDPEAHEGTAAQKIESPTDATQIEGLGYNKDSIAFKAFTIYSAANIRSLCASEIARITEKDKRSNSDGIRTTYWFTLSKDKIDSLAYYGIHDRDISKDDPSKIIFLTGNSDLKNKGLYESAIVNLPDLEHKFPALYAYGCAKYFADNKPKIVSSTITDQSTKYTDYEVEFTLADGQAVYLSYTVRSEHGRINVILNKNVDQ